MNIIFLIVIQFLIALPGQSSERTDSILQEDSEKILDNFQAKKHELKKFKSDLKKIENHIVESRMGQNAYVQFDKIAGSVVIVAIVIGSYKAHFPPGFRAMLSAYTSVTGLSKGMIKLSEKDMKIFLYQVKLLRSKIKTSEDNIELQSQYYCRMVDDHKMCGN